MLPILGSMKYQCHAWGAWDCEHLVCSVTPVAHSSMFPFTRTHFLEEQLWNLLFQENM